MKLTDKEFATIGPIIRAVTEAESGRFKKTVPNNPPRTAAVFNLIYGHIIVALMDAGVDPLVIIQDIDPTDVIVQQMEKDGYDVSKLCG